jgi:hypothetical protein
MSNCKTKNGAKKEIMGLTIFCKRRKLASCRCVEEYNMTADDVKMQCYLLHLDVGSQIACKIELAAVLRLSRFGKSFELVDHFRIGTT